MEEYRDMNRSSVISDEDLLALLRCPVSQQKLIQEGDVLATPDGLHKYPVVAGIPCLIPLQAVPTHSGFTQIMEQNRKWIAAPPRFDDDAVANFVQAMIVATGGNLFHGSRLNGRYPIVAFPRAFGSGPVLDIGCNWGRWTIAGGHGGYRMIGMDIHLEALLCAKALSQTLVPGNPPTFILGDARAMPLATESIGGVFSYSVLQHLSTTMMTAVLSEIKRVLRKDGKSLIQMPNRAGLRSFQKWLGRGFSDGSEFDVRYYSVEQLLRLFSQHIGQSTWQVDCFLGLNVHADEREFVAPSRRWIVDVAEALRKASEKWPFLRRFADSVFVSSVKA